MHTTTARLGTGATLFLFLAAGLIRFATDAAADPVTFSGTITYQGTETGDTLYVAVLDTVGVEDVTLLDIQAIAVGAPPLAEPYSLDFDNTGVGPELIIASFLDVDGGGIEDLSGADVFGWYAEGSSPLGVSSAASESGFDFALPRAEIRGIVTFGSGQTQATVRLTDDGACEGEGFRPGHETTKAGPYAIVGVYPGTYCVHADGNSSGPFQRVCHGDPTCASPTLITITGTEIVSGVDLDFSVLPLVLSSWGRVKARYD